jgi:hypothetical protein
MTEPTRAQAVHERLTVDGRLLPLELRPDRLSQFGALAHEGRLVGLDERVNLRFGGDRDLRVDLSVEQRRHCDLQL